MRTDDQIKFILDFIIIDIKPVISYYFHIFKFILSWILVAFAFAALFLLILWHMQVNKKIKPLKRIRDQILCGDLKEYDEIYKEYKRVK